MAGVDAMVQRQEDQGDMSLAAIRDQWEIRFSRFFCFPIITSTDSNLRPLLPHYLRAQGTWISSSSTATLQLLHHCSTSDLILSVRLRDTIIEEHYLSKMHFSWPQVSCISGFPARGTRTVFGSYTDSTGQIQKFALRFSTTYEIGSFVDILKEMSKVDTDIQPISSDFGSQISAHSDFLSSNILSDSLCEEFSNSMVQPYTPQMPFSLKDKEETHSGSKEETPLHPFESIFAALPPSFMSMLSNCSEVKQGATEAQPSATKDTDLKSQIMKCMEDSSFQDMLNRVEKIVNEMEGDLEL